MRFRLTYLGPLKSSQASVEHKHAIRREFHGQLRCLWETNKFLREWKTSVGVFRGHEGVVPSAVAVMMPDDPNAQIPLSDALATQYSRFGYRFVPLVREEAFLTCTLRILFLRRDAPGGLYNHSGDIDNRIKTVLDALSGPPHANQVPGPPQPGEDPFFVLLEDDKLVTHLEVETDTLYLPKTADADDDRALAQLIITVDVRPHYVTMQNLSYV
jgi:hypothetical protein